MTAAAHEREGGAADHGLPWGCGALHCADIRQGRARQNGVPLIVFSADLEVGERAAADGAAKPHRGSVDQPGLRLAMRCGRRLNSEESGLIERDSRVREPDESSSIALPAHEFAPLRPGDLGHPIDDPVHDVGELFGPRDTAFHHPVGEQGEADNVGTQNSGRCARHAWE